MDQVRQGITGGGMINTLPRSQLWLAYFPDFSGFAVFDSEIDALRYAVNNSMMVQEAQWGLDLRQQVNEK